MAIPKIIDYEPVGSAVLVELINPEEMIETTLELVGGAASSMAEDFGAPQAYVLAVGPAVKVEEWGFEVGDRIALSTKATPLPPERIERDTDDTVDARGRPKRARVILDSPAAIKAVIKEKKCCGGTCHV